MKHAYITGATGCEGRNLADILLENGWRITVLHIPSSDLNRLDGCDAAYQPVDLHYSYSETPAFQSGLDTVFHASGNVSHWSADADRKRCDNILATRNLVNASLRHGVGRFVFTSTGAVMLYGETDEAAAGRIKQCYLRTMRFSELEVLKGVERGLDALIVRPIIIVGKYSFNNYARIFQLFKSGPKRRSLPRRIDFCHAADVARGHLLAYENGRTGERYILAWRYASWQIFPSWRQTAWALMSGSRWCPGRLCTGLSLPIYAQRG